MLKLSSIFAAFLMTAACAVSSVEDSYSDQSEADLQGSWLAFEGRYVVEIASCPEDPRARCGYIAEVIDESEPQLDVRNYDALSRSKPLAGKKVLIVSDDGSASIYLAHSIGMTMPTVVTVDTDNAIDVTLCGFGGCSADRWVRNDK